MKKTLIIAALFVAVLMLGITSCKKDEKKCWKVEYVVYQSEEVVLADTEFAWLTKSAAEADVAAFKSRWEAQGCTVTVTLTEASEFDNAADCKAQNPVEE